MLKEDMVSCGLERILEEYYEQLKPKKNLLSN